jgi:hypothetical protein
MIQQTEKQNKSGEKRWKQKGSGDFVCGFGPDGLVGAIKSLCS